MKDIYVGEQPSPDILVLVVRLVRVVSVLAGLFTLIYGLYAFIDSGLRVGDTPVGIGLLDFSVLTVGGLVLMVNGWPLMGKPVVKTLIRLAVVWGLIVAVYLTKVRLGAAKEGEALSNENLFWIFLAVIWGINIIYNIAYERIRQL